MSNPMRSCHKCLLCQATHGAPLGHGALKAQPGEKEGLFGASGTSLEGDERDRGGRRDERALRWDVASECAMSAPRKEKGPSLLS